VYGRRRCGHAVGRRATAPASPRTPGAAVRPTQESAAVAMDSVRLGLRLLQGQSAAAACAVVTPRDGGVREEIGREGVHGGGAGHDAAAGRRATEVVLAARVQRRRRPHPRRAHAALLARYYARISLFHRLRWKALPAMIFSIALQCFSILTKHELEYSQVVVWYWYTLFYTVYRVRMAWTCGEEKYKKDLAIL
jgi:hypothetical protein